MPAEEIITKPKINKANTVNNKTLSIFPDLDIIIKISNSKFQIPNKLKIQILKFKKFKILSRVLGIGNCNLFGACNFGF